jgi:hypothetical protein
VSDRYVPTERTHRVLFGAGRRFTCHVRRRLTRFRETPTTLGSLPTLVFPDSLAARDTETLLAEFSQPSATKRGSPHTPP